MSFSNQKDSIWSKVWTLFLNDKKPIFKMIICLMLTGAATFIQPLIVRKITDQGMISKDLECIFIFSILLFITFLILRIIGVLQIKVFSDIHNTMTFTLYKDSFVKLMHLPIDYFYNKSSAEIVSNISTDINGISSIMDRVASLSIFSLLQIISGIIGLAILDWKLTLLILILLPLKYLAINKISKIKKSFVKDLIENNSKFSAWFGDNINGIKELKLWNMLDIKNIELKKLQENILDMYKKNMILDQYEIFIETILDALVNSGLYILSGYLIIRGNFTVGGAFAFISYSAYITAPISSIINIRYYMAHIKPSAKRLSEFFELSEESLKHTADLEENISKNSNMPLIEFDNVSFSFDNSKILLKNVSFKIYKNQRIAFIGCNGSGKTTIFNLLLGFYQPNEGEIRMNGIPLADIGLVKLREHFSVVSQDPYLFHTTVKENIDMLNNYSNEEINSICEVCGINKFIDKLPLGYEQTIGLMGAKLSGGEKQKLIIARALLKKSDILLLDEATSAYDINSIEKLNLSFDNQFIDKTIINITHQCENFKGIHQILKLENGNIFLVN